MATTAAAAPPAPAPVLIDLSSGQAARATALFPFPANDTIPAPRLCLVEGNALFSTCSADTAAADRYEACLSAACPDEAHDLAAAISARTSRGDTRQDRTSLLAATRREICGMFRCPAEYLARGTLCVPLVDQSVLGRGFALDQRPNVTVSGADHDAMNRAWTQYRSVVDQWNATAPSARPSGSGPRLGICTMGAPAGWPCRDGSTDAFGAIFPGNIPARAANATSPFMLADALSVTDSQTFVYKEPPSGGSTITANPANIYSPVSCILRTVYPAKLPGDTCATSMDCMMGRCEAPPAAGSAPSRCSDVLVLKSADSKVPAHISSDPGTDPTASAARDSNVSSSASMTVQAIVLTVVLVVVIAGLAVGRVWHVRARDRALQKRRKLLGLPPMPMRNHYRTPPQPRVVDHLAAPSTIVSSSPSAKVTPDAASKPVVGLADFASPPVLLTLDQISVEDDDPAAAALRGHYHQVAVLAHDENRTADDDDTVVVELPECCLAAAAMKGGVSALLHHVEIDHHDDPEYVREVQLMVVEYGHVMVVEVENDEVVVEEELDFDSSEGSGKNGGARRP
ncbi:hypothetical protein AMAG_10126 [Allomyces macrogynus ATCC 38327]|uniref:Uncharacterized protein n=1 Tax=Allomyces macrogynus (strain ATCC 38327) TaxID=578462 RepID=A0A0L0SQG1_ALLM3|nr:hypothetical protein AMAG_10126 [Allomyces macrogynus ATCC 38327]|eukprot:KNE64783.1 hypothetical protein AMAG_10126 [Allomyces macrogynus ATCC 38327]